MLPTENDIAQNDRNLQRLFLLRGLIFGGQAGAIVSAGFWLHAPPPWLLLAATTAVLATVNVLLWGALAGRQSEPAFFAQLLVDVAALALLLYFTGGATNPFVWLLLLSVAIAAIVLP
ncbi:MAG TPA: sensor histidine kinase, partial [Gammaproteobacteria bacterium]|nr:sensor histidine kinase [Gammaproteobacteria bacterium]